MNKPMMTASEVANIMEVSERTGYNIIKQLNGELETRGYLTRAGRIPRKYFYERTGLEYLSESGGEGKPCKTPTP